MFLAVKSGQFFVLSEGGGQLYLVLEDTHLSIGVLRSIIT